MIFRRDINGLRAIAVIAVVLFHFNASWLPGGFAGVDVFFVISGFLMTGIIFRGIEQENFSIFKFYVARANRIIPALAILCIVLLVFGWFYLTPLDYKALGKHVGSSMGFLSNIVYFTESGYFDASSHEKWLLHTWSLSTEWQFYIIYPLVLVAMRKFFSVKAMKMTVVLGTFVGFVLCVFVTYNWPNSAYYLLPTRAWEMMIGGVAYLYPLAIQNKRRKLIEWVGISLIVGSYILISEDNPWPGFLAFFPVIGSYLIIQAQRNDSFITGNIVFQKLGAWSYSIYLWHWPLVVAIYYFSLNDIFIYLGILLSVFLGYLSNKYIEKFKFRKNFSGTLSYFKCKPFYMVLFTGLIGSYVWINDGFNSSLRQGASSLQAQFLNKYEKAHRELDDAYWFKCNTYNSLFEYGTLITDSTCVQKKGKGGVFLWGDSHSEALSLGLRTLLDPLSVPFYQKTSSDCWASLTETTRQRGDFKKSCDYSNQLALKSIDKLKPRIVIIAQANGHDETDWINIFDKLSSYGVKHVLVIGPVSQWKPSLPRIMIKSKNWNTEDNFLNDSGLDLSIIQIDTKMKMKKFPSGLDYISLIDQLCRFKDEKYYCRVKVANDDLLQVDYGHLSKEGSVFVINTILAERIQGILNE
ncbi:acyltransferase family protein [Shewanella sp. WPAGA9]|uniref:acyltransferase family protein n=1 Tax=Shewanella sp. ENK2 TaxID=2775245 RepID=UPI00177DE301|nr:acyltransferase family protein [Shewanella sp. WPAGA9]